MNLLLNSIADGLADNGYAVVDQFLNEEEVRNILELKEYKEGIEHFKKAGIGKQLNQQINEAIRNDFIKWVDREEAEPALHVYLSRIKELIQFLNQSLYLSMKDYEVHLTIYPVGSFYKRHLDQFKSNDHRKLSIICYLNENWQEEEGGQLRMYVKEKTVDIFPLSGRLVCFRSDMIEHEVLPATRDRLSITGWILDQYVELKGM